MAADETVIVVGEIDSSKVDPAAKELIEEIRKDTKEHVFIQFASQKTASDSLIPFKEGKGVHFWDLEGKTYLDFAAQLFNLQLGHQHPTVVRAIQEQAALACYIRPTSNCYRVRSELAKQIAEVAPGDLNRVLFTTAGSDAVEYAVKIAKMVTGRDKVCTFYRSYHGSTFGCKSFGGDSKNWAGGSELPGVFRVHNPYAYRCPFGYAPAGNVDVYVKHVIDTIEYEGPHLTACLLMETISGSAGMVIIPPDGFLPRIREYCTAKGILLIADEVMTGYGRTGKMFAIEHFGVVPDIITCAKGITNGAVPLGACIVSEKVAAHFDDRILWAGLTYSGHPLAMAAALATLQAFKEESLLQRCQQTGVYLLQQLTAMQRRFSHVIGDIRAIGLLAVIELVLDPVSRAPVQDPTLLSSLSSYLEQRGLYLFTRWNCILITPPLIISPDQLQVGLDIISDCIEKFFPPPS